MNPRLYFYPALFLLTFTLLCNKTLQAQDIQGASKPRPTPTPANSTPAKNTPPKTNRPSTSRPNPHRNTQSTDPVTIELAYWDSIKDSTDPEDFRAYLKKYPNGQFADLAKNRLNKLEATTKPKISEPSAKLKVADPVWSLTILEEYFDSNIRQWYEYPSNEKGQIQVKEGKYYFESTTPGGLYAVTKSVAINQNEDFKIECTAQKIEGVNNYGYGFVWGLKDKNFYEFIITDNGISSVDKFEDGKDVVIIPWVEPNSINRFNSTNKLTLKKEGNQLQFFVNDSFVGRTQFQPFYGNFFGFIVYNKQTIAFDDLVISAKK